MKTECGQKFYCGYFDHDAIEDQHDYCCAERGCGHAHYPSFFNCGGCCWGCEECDQDYGCDECEEKAEVGDTDDVSGGEQEKVARPKLTLAVLSSGMSDTEDGKEDALLIEIAELPAPPDFFWGESEPVKEIDEIGDDGYWGILCEGHLEIPADERQNLGLGAAQIWEEYQQECFAKLKVKEEAKRMPKDAEVVHLIPTPFGGPQNNEWGATKRQPKLRRLGAKAWGERA